MKAKRERKKTGGNQNVISKPEIIKGFTTPRRLESKVVYTEMGNQTLIAD